MALIMMTQQQLQSLVEQIRAKVHELSAANDINSLKFNQQQQILDQYRMNIYNSDLKFNLLLKMMEEKGLMAKDEFNKRWPLYLKSDVGVIDESGRMKGELKISFYGK
jgi:hypothetical protein